MIRSPLGTAINMCMRPLSRASQALTGFEVELEPSSEYPGPPTRVLIRIRS